MSIQRFGLDDLLTCTRASSALVRNSAGVYSSVGNNVLRRSFEGGSFCLLAEEARTNSLPRNDMSGAVVGVLSSGGSLPTGWSVPNMPTSALEVVATGTENGLAYIDLRFNGTPTGIPNINLGPAVDAAVGQTWAGSFFVRRIAGSDTNIGIYRALLAEFEGSAFKGQTSVNITASITTSARKTVTHTLTDAASNKARVILGFTWVSGAVDTTLRIAAPQLEQGAFATSPIITTGSAVTRERDQIKLNDGLLAQVYGGGPVSVLTEFETEYVAGGSGIQRVWQMDDGTTDDRLWHRVQESNNSTISVATVGGSTTFSNSSDYTSGAALKVATRFAADDFAESRNGGAVATDTSGAMPTGLVNFGISNQGFNTASGSAPLLRLRKLILYPAALTNAELEALSA